MARTVKDQKLQSRNSRASLKPSPQPYYRAIDPGVSLGYRRGKIGGVWVLRRRFGSAGKYKVETFAVADDLSDPDGVGVLSFSQAQARARTMIGESNLAHGAVATSPMTVSDALKAYLDWLDNHGKSGASTRNRAKNDIEPMLGEIEVARLATKELRDWLLCLSKRPRLVRGKVGMSARMKDGPISEEDRRRRQSSANRSLTVLKAALNRAFHEKLVSSDAAWRPVRPFREADAVRLRYLSRDQARNLVTAADPDFGMLINAALLTGARYGELARLRVADFNSDAGTLLIRMSKAGKPRHIILSHEGMAFFRGVVAQRAADEVMLIKKDGLTWGVSHQARPMLETCKRAGIFPPINFHQLRHTAASHWIMDGIPLLVVARNLGHADTRMVEKHYGHLANDYMVNSIRQLAKPYGTVEALDSAFIEPVGG